MTYRPTGAGGLYRAVVLDLCSRAVVGWSLANHLRAVLVHHAVSLALGQHQPAVGLSRHTARGRQSGADS
jgi:putative transposase